MYVYIYLGLCMNVYDLFIICQTYKVLHVRMYVLILGMYTSVAHICFIRVQESKLT